jgi:3-dehydroquinate synthetase
MKSTLTYLKKLELFKELDDHKEGQFFAIADQKLKNHLPQWISFSPLVFWMKNPEEDKNLEVYSNAIEFFLKSGITRSSVIYAIGGGATTDFAGFVAATILRGVRWISIPTTLLGMIDGSIGGKVALNLPQGKNLVGAFHLPEKVLICGDFLTSLPEKEWMSGKGEMVKYGFLSIEINQLILKKAPIEEIAFACAKFKSDIVDRDLKETGDRIFLNLGHTLGHAFEYALKIPHGQAIAMGLKYLFVIMENHEAMRELDKMLKALHIPVEKIDIKNYPKFEPKKFLAYLEQDKKKIDASIRLVLVKGIGFCYVEKVTLKEFKSKITSHAEFGTEEW